ncbi:M18 family aminopeptidase [Paraoerskovia sediminicola]|uniref:M18 family aminopeptidase n=1 Tax=Paraoerskovia sediminicola TaxID=1138587 RepID=A0ABM8G090_9CELL|nr:M18 family aminopeptidase [Paraoerskovia sediminicola]BDZ41481.1 M18 family aminopeptidase [Paraoerskovia sediminicola]
MTDTPVTPTSQTAQTTQTTHAASPHDPQPPDVAHASQTRTSPATAAPADATARAHEHVADLARFVQASPSSFHAAQEVARRAEAAGFVRLDEADAWPANRPAEQGASGGSGRTEGSDAVPDPVDVGAPGRYVVVRDGAVVAWVVPPGATPTTGFTILGAHTDSPGFKLKPRPTTGRAGWWQAGVEVYGGPLLNSWLDRELELAGRVVVRTTDDEQGTERTADAGTGTGTGTKEHLVRTGPLLRLPQLAIHLDRGVNDGLTLDKQKHTQPVWGLGDLAEADLVAELAATVGATGADVLGYDVTVADTQEPRTFGAGQGLFASGRLDNLLSVHAGLVALLEHAEHVAAGSEGAPRVAVLAAFDHEEIGSASRSGAAGPFLEDVLNRVSAGLGASTEDRARALAASLCVSSDVGHSVHPNYTERHDPANQPLAGQGPILKINANQRYATDAVGAAAWAAACATAGVPSQEFVSNNALPCGSTIGPITATRLGIRTVDVGVPILSMHSAREMCAVEDPWYLSRAVRAAFAG